MLATSCGSALRPSWGTLPKLRPLSPPSPGGAEVIETRSLPFTMEEYQSRLSRIRDELRRRELAGLLVCSPHNIYWLTGFRTGVYSNLQPVIVPESGEPLMVSFD